MLAAVGGGGACAGNHQLTRIANLLRYLLDCPDPIVMCVCGDLQTAASCLAILNPHPYVLASPRRARTTGTKKKAHGAPFPMQGCILGRGANTPPPKHQFPA